VNNYEVLAAGIKAGDAGSFKEVYMQYFHKVKYYAMQYLDNVEEAEDIAQETFFELWRRRSDIDVSLSLSSYLLTAARNKCLNVLRDRINKARKHGDYAVEKKASLDYSALCDQSAERLLSSELEWKIKNSIDMLPPKTKEVFLMSRQNELSYAKIAEKMNISIKMVEYRMMQALKILRKYLKEYLCMLAMAGITLF
jgi:RNA polymerase sigma-70 factor (ECF subfamily)